MADPPFSVNWMRVDPVTGDFVPFEESSSDNVSVTSSDIDFNADPPIFKEVIVIGNGPSGIMLSFMLSGKKPFHNLNIHPDELLTARLKAANPHASFLDQDLEFLSQGMEGGTRNPCSLLMDALNNPRIDAGMDFPSLVMWSETDEKIDHTVVGMDVPGGIWNCLPKSLMTYSPRRLIQLPALNIAGDPLKRIEVGNVALYYQQYVHHYDLHKHMLSESLVLKAEPFTAPDGNYFWNLCIIGSDGHHMNYRCRYLVIANGICGRPRKLGILGESEEYVHHHVGCLEKTLQEAKQKSETLQAKVLNIIFRNPLTEESIYYIRQVHNAELLHTENPILVVGSGLSAFDAILVARSYNHPVVHCFRKRPNVSDYSPMGYPEYRYMAELAAGVRLDSKYTSLFNFEIVRFLPDKSVVFRDPQGQLIVIKVAFACIMIGWEQDLSFLPNENIGRNPNERVNYKTNQVPINPFTHEVIGAYKNLYAIGSITGDHFVRFCLGGALAVASDLFKKYRARDWEKHAKNKSAETSSSRASNN